MKKRAFSISSSLLILLAILLNLNAFGAAAEQNRYRNAMNIANVQMQQELRSEANGLSHKSDMFIMSGWGLVVAGLICLYVRIAVMNPERELVRLFRWHFMHCYNLEPFEN